MGGSEVEAARISRPVHVLAALASIASLAGCVNKPQTALPGPLLSLRHLRLRSPHIWIFPSDVREQTYHVFSYAAGCTKPKHNEAWLVG